MFRRSYHAMSHSEQTRSASDAKSADVVPFGLMRKLVRFAVRMAVVAVTVLGISGWIIYASAQKEPDFYHAALELNEQTQIEQADVFEQRLLDLQNEARTKHQWQVVFTETQINGWLASDFPKKFPAALPPNVSDPRVGIDNDGLRMAFRFNSRRIKGIVQAEVDAFCTERPGQLAIQLKSVRSGLVPIPVNSIADRISTALRRLGVQVQWTEIAGDPVALIDLPPDKLRIGNKLVTIEAIELLDEKLVLTGKSVAVE
jgi:hypothetical protein